MPAFYTPILMAVTVPETLLFTFETRKTIVRAKSCPTVGNRSPALSASRLEGRGGHRQTIVEEYRVRNGKSLVLSRIQNATRQVTEE